MGARSKSTMRLMMVALASAALGLAQTSGQPNYNQYGNRTAPTAVPGTVNYVEGQVSLDGQQLNAGAVGTVTLRPWQNLQTGNGYAEVLLTPGAFLRLGNGSDVQLETAGLANTRVHLLGGTALLEVDQLINGTNLAFDLNHGNAVVLKKGLYDFDEAGQAVRVLDGKLKITGAAKTKEIGKDDQVLFANGDSFQKTEFSSKLVKDTPLYAWSEARSQLEAQENVTAARNASNYTAAGPGWYWDPYANFYGFWPTSAYLYSPFGFGFYSPAYFGFYGGFYGQPYRYYGGYRGAHYGHVGGFSAVRVGGGFHSAGFHGGGGHR